MNRILLLAALLSACASEQPLEQADTGAETSGAAGSVGVQTEALNGVCAQLHQYMRNWFDQNTPGTLSCGANYLADRYQCTTASPPIIYTFQLRGSVAGSTCSKIIYAYTQSQSNKVYEISCTQNGASASCSRRALN